MYSSCKLSYIHINTFIFAVIALLLDLVIKLIEFYTYQLKCSQIYYIIITQCFFQ